MTANIIPFRSEPDNDSTPPYNTAAEQALLGALLLDNQQLEHVVDFLLPEHFSHPLHAKVFDAILHLNKKGYLADPITLKDYFAQDEVFKEIGGITYLLQLVDSIISVVSVQDYGRIIHDLYLRRQLMIIGQEMVIEAKSFEMEETASQQIEISEKKLYDLATKGTSSGGLINFRSSLTQAIQTAQIAYKRDGQVVGVTTGLADLDKWLGGLHSSDLIIIAGRPSMGKTALATNIAFNAAHDKKIPTPVAFFSLEMSSEQLATRILAAEAGISSDKIRRGDVKAADFSKFIDVSRDLQDLPLFIDDTPALTVTALRNRARRLQRQHGLGLIVIDYLQLIQPAGSRKQDNRVVEISEITRNLKALAKELHVPVVALSQLSRGVEQRDDKRPQLSDLRESGSIEQDSDVVMFVFREEYYESRREPPPGTEKHQQWLMNMARVYNQAEVIIAKQRHGPVGTIKLYFDGSLTRFANLEQSHTQSSA